MKKLILLFAVVSLSLFPGTLRAQSADAILGSYYSSQEGDEYKVRVTKAADGTYMGQIFWVADSRDENGNVYLDDKNPDPSLRNTPCDRIVLVTGLTYKASDNKWVGGKIYDPQRGKKFNCTAWFEGPSVLKVRGSLLGFGETVTWKRL